MLAFDWPGTEKCEPFIGQGQSNASLSLARDREMLAFPWPGTEQC